MDQSATVSSVTDLAHEIRRRLAPVAGERALIGLVGAPGAGKSTLAASLAAALGAPGEPVPVVPMDGFHRRNDDLERAGLRDRKGAPETFDVDAFVELVRRLGDASVDHDVPTFDRTIDEPVDGGTSVPAGAPMVVVEGNYLLLDHGGWEALAPLLDVTAAVEVDDERRVADLVARHVRFGRTPEDAEAFVMRSDEANARIVLASLHRADLHYSR